MKLYNKWLTIFLVCLAAVIYLLGYLDALFFRTWDYTLQIFGTTLMRKDLYFCVLSALVVPTVFGFISLVKIGYWSAKEEIKLSYLKFSIFTLVNLLLYATWLWALSWLQLTDFFDAKTDKLLDLWRIGTLRLAIPMNYFYLLLFVAFLAHLFLVVLCFKKHWLEKKVLIV